MDFNTKIDKRPISEIAADFIKELKSIKRDVVRERIFDIDFHYYQNGYGVRPFGSGCDERIRKGEALVTEVLKMDNVSVEMRSMNDIRKVCDEIRSALKNDVCYKVNTMEYTDGGWPYERHYEVISFITMITHISKSFSALQRYLHNYANYDLSIYDCYYSDTFGKRGVYAEKGKRNYLCVDDKLCDSVIAEFRKAKKPNDIVEVTPYSYSNEEDSGYSREYETECYGSVRKGIDITIKTPGGKVKMQKRI